ncbi:MAG: diguanylate cyclase, partial [Spirochaetales bacterium]|nr:diguanylate cyclase [Spirochaetales bacterium]
QQEIQFQAILFSLEHIADAIFQNGLNKEEILSIIAKAPDASAEEQQELRDLLHRKLAPAYEHMKAQGVVQLHFHLPDSISFLRFHRLHKFGDSLNGVRHSIDLVNSTHQPVKGFEEGRVFYGFRNVYPLNYHDTFIGTVEVSYSFIAIRDLAVELFPAIYSMILDKKIVSESIWLNEQSQFKQCLISDAYVKDKAIVRHIRNELQQLNIASIDELRQTNTMIRPLVEKKLATGQAFSIFYHPADADKSLIISFVPIKNVKGQQVAYFISYQKDRYLVQYFNRFTRMCFIIVGVGIVLLLAGYFYMRQEIKRQEYSILATTDSLTGLANRRHFDLIADRMIKETTRSNGVFSLVMVDIDDFKPINDTLGHDAGDKVLQNIATLLQQNLREQDFVARWGGEEFVILLPRTSGEQACLLCEKLRLIIAETALHHTDKATVQLTCSFGIAEFIPSLTPDDLIKKADTALYKAKAKGKNCIIHNHAA